MDRAHPGHARFGGLGHRSLGSQGHHDLTQPVVTVDQRTHRCLPKDRDLGTEIDAACLDPHHVLGDPDQAVTGPPSQIGLEQPAGGHLGVLG